MASPKHSTGSHLCTKRFLCLGPGPGRKPRGLPTPPVLFCDRRVLMIGAFATHANYNLVRGLRENFQILLATLRSLKHGAEHTLLEVSVENAARRDGLPPYLCSGEGCKVSTPLSPRDRESVFIGLIMPDGQRMRLQSRALRSSKKAERQISPSWQRGDREFRPPWSKSDKARSWPSRGESDDTGSSELNTEEFSLESLAVTLRIQRGMLMEQSWPQLAQTVFCARREF